MARPLWEVWNRGLFDINVGVRRNGTFLSLPHNSSKKEKFEDSSADFADEEINRISNLRNLRFLFLRAISADHLQTICRQLDWRFAFDVCRSVREVHQKNPIPFAIAAIRGRDTDG